MLDGVLRQPAAMERSRRPPSGSPASAPAPRRGGMLAGYAAAGGPPASRPAADADDESSADGARQRQDSSNFACAFRNASRVAARILPDRTAGVQRRHHPQMSHQMLACRLAHLGAKATIGLLSSLLEQNVHSELSALRSGKLPKVLYNVKRITYMLINIGLAKCCGRIVISVLSRFFQCPPSCRKAPYLCRKRRCRGAIAALVRWTMVKRPICRHPSVRGAPRVSYKHVCI